MAEVDVYNAALGHIAQGVVLSDPQENSNEGRACRRFYPGARDTVLCAHEWRFATRTAALTPLSTVPSGARFAYAMPAGCLEVRKITELAEPEAPGLDWRKAGVTDPSGYDWNVLLSDSTTQAGFVTFVRRVEDLALWDRPVVEALEWLLASKIAGTFVRDEKRREECFRRYLFWLEEAKVKDQRQFKDPPIRRPTFVTERR